MSATVESQPNSPGIKKYTRRRFLEKLAIFTGTVTAGAATIDEGWTQTSIGIQVNHETPAILYHSDARKDFTSKRDALSATKNKTPQQEESLNMMNQVLTYDAIQEPRRTARYNELKTESDNTPVIGDLTYSQVKRFALEKGVLLAGAGILSKTRLPDWMLRKITTYLSPNT